MIKSVQNLAPGLKYTWKRTITEEEIRRFAEVSGDQGRHHLEKDEKGRLIAHGLLTATLPTKIGGELNFIAREMHFQFLRPVYGGDELTCAGVVDSVDRRPRRILTAFSFSITNQDGREVLKGTSSGYILL